MGIPTMGTIPGTGVAPVLPRERPVRAIMRHAIAPGKRTLSRFRAHRGSRRIAPRILGSILNAGVPAIHGMDGASRMLQCRHLLLRGTDAHAACPALSEPLMRLPVD